MDTFSDRLKWARERAGFNQTELARRVGIAASSINQMETQPRKGSRHMSQLARVLGVNAYWLETGIGQPTGMSEAATRVAELFARLTPEQQARLAPIIEAAIGNSLDDAKVEEKMPVTKTLKRVKT